MNIKEITDQALHFFIGFFITTCLITPAAMPGAVALIMLMAGAYIRELWQHDWNYKSLGDGAYLDLAMWFLGGAVAWIVTI